MRLPAGPAGSQPDGLRFGCVQIADRKIEMHLFRDRAARPGRRPVIGYPHCRDRGAMAFHHDDIVAEDRLHFAAEEPRPERGQTGRVIAIEADKSQASECHGPMLTATPQRQPFCHRSYARCEDDHVRFRAAAAEHGNLQRHHAPESGSQPLREFR